MLFNKSIIYMGLWILLKNEEPQAFFYNQNYCHEELI